MNIFGLIVRFLIMDVFDRDKYILKQFMLAFLIPFNLVSHYNHVTILLPHDKGQLFSLAVLKMLA